MHLYLGSGLGFGFFLMYPWQHTQLGYARSWGGGNTLPEIYIFLDHKRKEMDLGIINSSLSNIFLFV